MTKPKTIPLPTDKYGRTLHIGDWVCFDYRTLQEKDDWHSHLEIAKIRTIEIYPEKEDRGCSLSFYESTCDDYVQNPEENCVKITGKAAKFLDRYHNNCQRTYKDFYVKHCKTLTSMEKESQASVDSI